MGIKHDRISTSAIGPLPVNHLAVDTYTWSLLAKTNFWFNGAERRDPDTNVYLSTVSVLIKIFPSEENTCLFCLLEVTFQVVGKSGVLIVEINSSGAMCISILFLEGIRKPLPYFIFEYFMAIYVSLEKHIAFEAIKILQILLNHCASKSISVNTNAGFRIKGLLCSHCRALSISGKPDRRLDTQLPPPPSSFHRLI